MTEGLAVWTTIGFALSYCAAVVALLTTNIPVAILCFAVGTALVFVTFVRPRR